MDLLNVQEGTSRPSILSSIWSLQVQMQNETDPLALEMPALFGAGGSQQSLPGALSGGVVGTQSMAAATSSEMILHESHNEGQIVSLNLHHSNSNGFVHPFRTVKSLSDLKSLTLSRPAPVIGIANHYLSIDSPITEATSAILDYRHLQIPSTSAAPASTALSYNDATAVAQVADASNGAISRQQRNSNVCAWLQSLSLGGDTLTDYDTGGAVGRNFSFLGGTTAMEMETQPQ